MDTRSKPGDTPEEEAAKSRAFAALFDDLEDEVLIINTKNMTFDSVSKDEMKEWKEKMILEQQVEQELEQEVFKSVQVVQVSQDPEPQRPDNLDTWFKTDKKTYYRYYREWKRQHNAWKRRQQKTLDKDTVVV